MTISARLDAMNSRVYTHLDYILSHYFVKPTLPKSLSASSRSKVTRKTYGYVAGATNTNYVLFGALGAVIKSTNIDSYLFAHGER